MYREKVNGWIYHKKKYQLNNQFVIYFVMNNLFHEKIYMNQ